VGLHRLSLALDPKRLQRLDLEGGARPGEDVVRDEDLARGRPCHQAGGEVRSISLEGVGAAVGRPEVRGEQPSAADADLERQAEPGIGDRAYRAEHPLLVVSAARRCSGDEHDLAAPGSDVRVEERDLVLEGDALDRVETLLEGVGDRVRAGRREQLVGSAEVEERDRERPVLRLAAAFDQVATDRHGHAAPEIDVRDVTDAVRPVDLDDGRACEHDARAPGSAEQLRIELPRRRPGDDDLAWLREGLGFDGRVRGRSDDDELPVQLADEEEVEATRVDADRHPQSHSARRGS
jgi:hypothetical protein